MSRASAVRYCHRQHERPSIIISIGTPLMEYTSAPFVSKENNVQAIKQLLFADADKPGKDVYGTDVTEKDLMTDKDGKKIFDFVTSHPDCDVIVHCDAGYSRSAGVGAAIMYALNSDDSAIFDSGLYHPNMWCYRKTLNAFMS